MEINQAQLAELVQGLITDALVKGGIIPATAATATEPVPVPPTPEFLVTVNGEVVGATIADEDELNQLISATKAANRNAVINVYELSEENVQEDEEDDEDEYDDEEDEEDY